jgi:nucleotide-binding universal stress UspA family protein
MIHILLPTDFSENAQKAADFVFEMFGVSNFKLVLVHGVVPPRTTPGMMINITDLMQEDAERDLKIEKKRLEEKYDCPGLVQTKAKLGYLQDILPAIIAAHNADMIVMGTRGDNTIANKVLGSNTEQIVRLGLLPLLAVPTEFEIEERPKVCIATTKSEIPHVEVVERILNSLKNKQKTKLSVLHVLTSDTETAHKSLPLNGMQVAVATEIANSPEEGMNVHLANTHLDMLVVCHRHNSRIDYLFSRSTTKKLTGQIHVPLLILPG